VARRGGEALRRPGVVTCSAVRRAYRDRLRERAERPVGFVFLNGSREVLLERMKHQADHFMPVSLLDSQLATLEDPTGEAGVVAVDVDRPVAGIVSLALERLAGAGS
jgi:gluconokinase